MLRFDPATGLYVDDTAFVRAQTETLWKEALGEELDTTPGSPAGQLVDSQTALVAEKDRQLLYLANQFNPAANEGVWQDALGQIYFMDRLGSAPTLVECLCTGLPGTIVAGTVKAETGAFLTSVSSALIPSSGSVLVSFRTVEEGPIVIPENSVRSIITTVPGWDTVINPAKGVEGRHVEGPQEFEARRNASVASNSQGRAAAISGALQAVPDVVDSVALENFRRVPEEQFGVLIPAHSFFICVAGGAEVDIAQAIYRKKDGGAGTAGNTAMSYIDPEFPLASYEYNVERPTNLNIDVTVTVKRTASTPSDIAARVELAVTENFYGRGGMDRVRMASMLYASRFYAPVALVGVESLESVKLDAGDGQSDAVVINADRLPNLASVVTVMV